MKDHAVNVKVNFHFEIAGNLSRSTTDHNGLFGRADCGGESLYEEVSVKLYRKIVI